MLKIDLIPSDREPTNTISHNKGATSFGVKQYSDGHLGFSMGDSYCKAYFYSESDAYAALEGHDINVTVRRFRERYDGYEYCDVTINGITCSVTKGLLESYIKENPDILEQNHIKYRVLSD